MSNSVAVNSVSPAIIPGAMAIGANGASDTNGLFLNFMGMFGKQNVLSNSNNAQSPITFGKSGFNFDPALLVLPAGMANLSEAELSNFLATQAAGNKFGLSNDILQSLTTGTPIANLINAAQVKADGIASTTINSNNIAMITVANDLATAQLNTENMAALNANAENIANANPLLLATGLSPLQMEQMQKQLDASAKADKDSKDMGDNTNMVFIAFLPIDAQSQADKLSSTAANAAVDAHQVKTDIVTANGISLINTATANDDALIESKITDKQQSLEQDKLSSMKNDTGAIDTGVDTGAGNNNSNDKSGEGPKNNNLEGHKANTNNASSVGLMHGHFSQFFTLPDGMSGTNPFGLTEHANANALANSNALTAPLLNNQSAATVHPTVQTIAMKIEKAAKAENKEQILSIQLDPPELGRLQIQLTYEKGSAMKVHLLTEKQETFNLLQRDSHALRDTLTQAGVQLNGSSLTFDMAGGGQSFDQMMGGFNQDTSGSSNKEFNINSATGEFNGGDDTTIITHMNDVPDFSNGNVNYSFFA